MLNTQKNMNINLRKKIVEGEELDRKLSLQLQKKFQPISEAIWKQKQDEIYMNTLRIKPSESLGSLLANELENKNQNDPLIVEQISRSLLLQITDKKIVDYIIERLSSSQMNRMNQFWPEILAYLKKRNLKLNKDVFVEYLKRNEDFGDGNQPVNIPALNPINENVEIPGMDMNEEEDDENNNNKKRKKGEAEYDLLYEQDQLEGIKAYDIGDMETNLIYLVFYQNPTSLM